MHFWIDKRSQCAYSGRHRVPSSLSSGVGRGRTRVCVAGGARKGMAAPVHRFAAVDCPPRRPHRPHRHYNPPAQPAPSGGRRGASLYVEVGEAPPTIASLAAARSVTPDTLLRTAALGLQHSPVMAPHLKFGMLVSFALATVFLAGAKYYFDKQIVREGSGAGAGGEAGVVCAAVACVCGVGCALSLCRARPPPALPPERVTSTAHREPVSGPRGARCGVGCALSLCRARPPPALPPERVTSTAHREPVSGPRGARCGVGCALSLCRARPPPALPPERVTSTAHREPQAPSEPSDDISLATLLGPERPVPSVARETAEAPPPYSVAVLMPGVEREPPPYSALS
ncbi:uncharacterized protein LOC114365398 [Ostrinia furnacalis]|uniref:uncharacterized protein LOC114365398 n=1 Tax=Ostrinia furnacalis TaxID=93504 RepID=UPI00103EB6CC|nr:uncharacterized protein LOC114365398 [Ostrinia furnacalis]